MLLGARSKSLAICQTTSDTFAGLAVGFFDERVEDGAFDLFFGNGQPHAAMALRVHVDQQGFLPQPGQAGGQIDAGGGFTAAALLIDDRNGPHVKPSLVSLRNKPADPSAGGNFQLPGLLRSNCPASVSSQYPNRCDGDGKL